MDDDTAHQLYFDTLYENIRMNQAFRSHTNSKAYMTSITPRIYCRERVCDPSEVLVSTLDMVKSLILEIEAPRLGRKFVRNPYLTDVIIENIPTGVPPLAPNFGSDFVHVQIYLCLKKGTTPTLLLYRDTVYDIEPGCYAVFYAGYFPVTAVTNDNNDQWAVFSILVPRTQIQQKPSLHGTQNAVSFAQNELAVHARIRKLLPLEVQRSPHYHLIPRDAPALMQLRPLSGMPISIPNDLVSESIALHHTLFQERHPFAYAFHCFHFEPIPFQWIPASMQALHRDLCQQQPTECLEHCTMIYVFDGGMYTPLNLANLNTHRFHICIEAPVGGGHLFRADTTAFYSFKPGQVWHFPPRIPAFYSCVQGPKPLLLLEFQYRSKQ